MNTKPYTMDRRSFLRGTGVTLALPLFEAMRLPLRAAGLARATGPAGSAVASSTHASPMRMVTMANPFGMLPDRFFPAQTGANYTMPELLEPLAALRRDFTVFSHLDHGVAGGHRGVHALLSGFKDVDAGDQPLKNISLDQRAAEHVGAQTRFPSICASPGTIEGHLDLRMSWTRNGITIPPITSTTELFRALFVADDAAILKQRAAAYELHGSILDTVREQSKSLERRLGRADREKFDQYLTSVREVERKLGMSHSWLQRPKPKVDLDEPKPGAFTVEIPMFFDLIALALQTDSTRVASLGIPACLDTADLGVSGGYHGLSHHGKSEGLVKPLAVIEKYQMAQLARFLGKLKTLREPDGATLLDRTMVLFGSGMGNGSAHSNADLPILLAGGGFKHGEHKSYPEETARRVPLCNLYTTMLQRFGVETERFNKATGTLTGFDAA